VTSVATFTLPGDLRSASEFRGLAARALAGLPAGVVEDGRLVASELAANASEHSRSALPGGEFTGRIEVGAAHVVIEVVDQGSDSEAPEVVDLVDAVRGRGLLICSKLGQLSTDTTPDGGRRVAVRLPISPEVTA
jgi:anti-sigma regulatory factor (Ser/Thr protein kinase)